MEDSVHHRPHRQAVTVSIGLCLLAACAVSLWNASEGKADLVTGQVQLLSTDNGNQLKETLRLKQVHAAYDQAKQKLQVLSIQYGQMGERLQQAGVAII